MGLDTERYYETVVRQNPMIMNKNKLKLEEITEHKRTKLNKLRIQSVS